MGGELHWYFPHLPPPPRKPLKLWPPELVRVGFWIMWPAWASHAPALSIGGASLPMTRSPDAPPEIPTPWDAYESQPLFDGKLLEPANDVPPALILWILHGCGWTWPQYVAWAKLHPRHHQGAPPF